MKSPWRWLDRAVDLGAGLRQAQEEGREYGDWTALQGRVRTICEMPPDDPERTTAALAMTDFLEGLPIRAANETAEPSDLDRILAARPEADIDLERMAVQSRSIREAALFDKIYGAWLGRCAGCLLGQPVEGWTRARILGLLRDTDNFPIRNYMSSAIHPDIRHRYGVEDVGSVYGSNRKNWINNVSHAPEDDDTNYTVLAFKLFDRAGAAFSSSEMAENWLMNMPLLHACTAERVAYVNLASGMPSPQSAWYRNPYREWIGAQIRGDFFGYVCPGNPAKAARLAYKDACISHVKNGVYGELFVAAMIAAAALEDDPGKLVLAGLSQIPSASRLAKQVREILSAWRSGVTPEQLVQRVHDQYDESDPFDWCHVIPNALIVTIAVLTSELDFCRAIGLSVEAGFDTDCNAATVGSVVGMTIGTKGIPALWKAPLSDRLKTGIDGFDLPRISDLARRTVTFATQCRAAVPDAVSS